MLLAIIICILIIALYYLHNLLLLGLIPTLGIVYLLHDKIDGGNDDTDDDNTDNNDIYQLKLESELVNIYKTFDTNFNPDVINNLRQYHIKTMETHTEKYPDPLVDFPIRNGKCVFSDRALAFNDDRCKQIYNLISDTLSWCKTNKYKVPDTTLYIYISDKCPWDIEFTKYPIFVFAKPRGFNYPIFPDNTFEGLSLYHKYRGESYNWDKLKKKIMNNDKSNNKREIIYFHGSNTTNRNHNMRKILEEFSNTNTIPLEIHLDAWSNYEPIWSFTKYKYLLNLPGRYPWSNRLKYLLLINSIVINISVKTVTLGGSTDEPWESFIDYIVEPNVHYIDIPYTYYTTDSNSSEKDIENAQKLKTEEDKNLLDELVKTYNDIKQNPQKFKDIVKTANNVVQKLSLTNIYKYIYKAITLNAQIVP